MRQWGRWIRVGAVVGIFLLSGSGCVRPGPAAVPPAAAAQQELGIDIVGIRRTAAGYMLDFRYRVLDPAKTGPLFDRSVRPYLVHEASGASFAVPSSPKVGPLRQTTAAPEAGRQYFIFFANPGQYVQSGDQVTVVIGERRFEHLTVE